ncbi:MAG TPA: hypothetical protein VGE35_01100 [Candidatus Paceibacterota bacterium]
MKWINILHIYQPPTQTKEVVDQVARESYQKIVDLLDAYPKLRLTMNVSGSLLELLKNYGHEPIIAGLRRHAERGAIEFLGSAMYHGILPLLSSREIGRQIKLHDAISRECFGDAYKPRGFYFPEMAYSAEAGLAIKGAGFEWVILDEIHAADRVDWARAYLIKDVGLGVIFRDSRFSKTFPPQSIIEASFLIAKDHMVTCHDGELYGHWHKDDRGFYKKAFADSNIEYITASEYVDEMKARGMTEIVVRDASWESRAEELENNVPHGLWNDPNNEIHASLESLKRRVLTAVESHQEDPGYSAARHYADRGVASCAWWWASERKLGPFSPVCWNPTEIEKGAKELQKAYDALQTVPAEEASAIRADFEALLRRVWDKHKSRA